jgi:hypothetical protein
LGISIRDLTDKVDSREFAQLAKTIITDFIEHDSKKEVNISGTVKEKTLKDYKDYVQGNLKNDQLFSTFSELLPIINSQMKADTFPRFIRTQAFQTMAPSLCNNKKVMVPRIVQTFSFSNSDFQIPCLTEKDFAFCKYLNEDFYDWELSFSAEGVNGYYTNMHHFSEIGYMKDCSVAKLVVILPYSFDVCVLVNSNFDHLGMVSKKIEGCNVEKFYSVDEIEKTCKDVKHLQTCCAHTTTYTNLFYPMHMRRIPQLSTAVQYDDNVSIISKPFVGKEEEKDASFTKRSYEYEINGKKQKKQMYTMPCYSTITLTKIDDTRTLHTSIAILNTGGWLNGKVVRDLSNKYAFEKLSKDLFKKYEILTKTKFPIDSKLDKFKDVMQQNAQGKMMHSAIFEQVVRQKVV